MSKADNKNHETVNQEEFMRRIGDTRGIQES